MISKLTYETKGPLGFLLRLIVRTSLINMYERTKDVFYYCADPRKPYIVIIKQVKEKLNNILLFHLQGRRVFKISCEVYLFALLSWQFDRVVRTTIKFNVINESAITLISQNYDSNIKC